MMIAIYDSLIDANGAYNNNKSGQLTLDNVLSPIYA